MNFNSHHSVSEAKPKMSRKKLSFQRRFKGAEFAIPRKWTFDNCGGKMVPNK